MSDKNKNPAPRQEWEIDALRAVPDRLVADIVGDAYRGISKSASMISEKQRSSEPERLASGSTAEVKPPPGIDIIDRMCAEQDRLDRAAAIRQRVEADWIEHLLEKPSRVAKDYNPYSKEWLDK
jgi:hypothetical protein